MRKVRVGMVGFGLMGQLYADALLRNPLAEVTAVSDLREDRQELARKKCDCRVATHYQEMVDAGGLDAVIIATPDFMHREPVVAAAEAGLHILVEKPFATSVADAEAMVQAVDQAGVKCMVEFFNRWSPPFTAAKEAVARGELGEIITYNIELNDPISVPTQMLAWSARSSPAWFLMSHTADLAFWITDKRPVSVTAHGVKKLLVQRGIDTYDLIEAIVEYADGTLGRLTNNWVLPNGMPIGYELKMRIVGTDAAMDIDTSDQELHLVTQERLTHPITAWGEILGRHVGHPYTMLAAFIDNIIEETEPLIGPLEGLNNSVFLDAVHRSVAGRQRIEIEWRK